VQRQYWRFYWPLALTGVVLLLGRQFQNGVLASYEEAARELATYALAMSVFMPFGALLVFVPQMANVLARSPQAHRVCLRFTVVLCLALTVPVALLAFAPPGRTIVGWIFDLDAATLDAVVGYLRLLTPLVLVRGLRQYVTGMLVQDRHTRTVTALNVLYLGVLIGMLMLGLRLGWPALVTLMVAQIAAGTLHLATSCLACGLRHRYPANPQHADLTYGETLAFFWPVATTSLMFALTRPVLYAFINRTARAVVTVAALRVAFDFAMFFHAPVNQFRHLFVTFGDRDPAGLRRFMGRVMLALTAVMVLVAFTPLGPLVLRRALNLKADILELAVQTMRVLCATPLVITVRNYFHGRLLTGRRTGGMALGGIFRVLATCAAAWPLYRLGWLNHATAAAVLQVGFAAEAIISAAYARWARVSPAREMAEAAPS
jgi:hypothetical protein